MNRDTVIGIVGALILVAAMVGVFKYEQARAPGAIGPADWRLANLTSPEESGVTVVGASAEAMLDLSPQNMTRVAFMLTWTPSSTPAGANTDTVRLTLAPPPGVEIPAENLTMEGTSGSIELVVDLPNPKPTATTPGTIGTGAWNATIEFVSTDDPTSPLPVPAQQQIVWRIGAIVTAWQPVTVDGASDA